MTIFLDNYFQPDLIPKTKDTSISKGRQTELLGSEIQEVYISKQSKPTSLDFDAIYLENARKRPSVFDDLALLTTTNETPKTEPELEVDGAIICNDTIAKQDSSILAGFDAALMLRECRSVDSEYDNTEYEFQPKKPLSRNEIETHSTKTENQINEELGRLVKDEQSEGANPHLREGHLTEDEPTATEGWMPMASKRCRTRDGSGLALKTGRLDYDKVATDTGRESTAIDHNSACHSMSNNQAFSRPKYCSFESSPLKASMSPSSDDVAKARSKFSPFSNIIFDMRIKTKAKENTVVNNRANQDEDPTGEECLRDFLMRSGLFCAT